MRHYDPASVNEIRAATLNGAYETGYTSGRKTGLRRGLLIGILATLLALLASNALAWEHYDYEDPPPEPRLIYSLRYQPGGGYVPHDGVLSALLVYDAGQSWVAGRSQNGVWAINSETGQVFRDVVFAPEFNTGRCAIQGLPISDRHQGVSVAVAADGWIVADNAVQTAASARCEAVVIYRLDRGVWTFHRTFTPVATWAAKKRTVVRENMMWLPLDPSGSQCMAYRISDLTWFGNEACPGQVPTTTAWRVDTVATPAPWNPALNDLDFYLAAGTTPPPTPGPTYTPLPTSPPTTSTATPTPRPPTPTPLPGAPVPCGVYGWCCDSNGDRVFGWEEVDGVCVPVGATQTPTASPTTTATAVPATPTATSTSTPTAPPPTATTTPDLTSTPQRMTPVVSPVGTRPPLPGPPAPRSRGRGFLVALGSGIAASIVAWLLARDRNVV
jgi:hypothetical protein